MKRTKGPLKGWAGAQVYFDEMRRQTMALHALNEARRKVMELGGGNLDHPALAYIEAAMQTVKSDRTTGRED